MILLILFFPSLVHNFENLILPFESWQVEQDDSL